MRIQRLSIFLLFTFAIASSTYTQISFQDQTSLLISELSYSGVAMSVTDMNGDGLDDIVRLGNGTDLVIEYQQADGSMFAPVAIGSVGQSSQWSMCVADVDNDGQNEVFSGEAYGPIEIMHSSLDFASVVMTTLPGGDDVFVQGSNFVDINNDGLLDIFVCHDDGASVIWGNQGDGTFVEQPTWIDLSIAGSLGENASGNYGSIWTDFDNDGDMDLYIAKCRQGVVNPADQRRINKLYVNDGSGNFTEESAERGLDIGWQSWTADFQDVNNDGHLDVFITNHDHASQIFMNDGAGYFTELENSGIDVTGLPIQGVMRDFDNDGFVDILVAGNSAQIFMNNGDSTFTEVNGAFDEDDMESFALGDLNGDGYVDVYGGYAFIYTTPSNVNDKTWINQSTGNNHLSVSLIGQISNRNGIGARIEAYGPWGKQIREVRSGESYGIMNSMTQYFGLGVHTAIDSLVIKWPSGLSQTEYNVAVNSRVQVIEGGCLAEAPDVVITGNTVFCDGDSLILSVPDEYVSYKWSDGQTGSSIVVYTAGNYGVVLETEDGCTAFSEMTNVIVDPQLTPVIYLTGDDLICEGEEVTLTLEDLDADYPITWSNSETISEIAISETGIYTAAVQGLCSEFTSNAIELTVESYPLAPIVKNDTIVPGSDATLTAIGNNIAWYAAETDIAPLAIGNSYSVSGLTERTAFWAADRNGDPGATESVGMLDHAGSPYSGIPNTNLLIFDALSDFTIDSVKVYTDLPGVRRVTLLDFAFNVISFVDVDVPVGETYIYLGLDVPAGISLSLSTDAAINQENLGQQGPRLQRSSSNVAYPYLIDDVVNIKDSNFGAGYYYYFYDWKVSTGTARCEGERAIVEVVMEEENSTSNIYEAEGMSIYPNPTSGEVMVSLPEDISEHANVTIYNNLASIMKQEQWVGSDNSIDLSMLPAGTYLIAVQSESRLWRTSVVLIK